MNISIAIKSLIAKFYCISGSAERKISEKYKEHFLVLMYHRVLPENELTINVESGMYVTPDTFRLHLQYLKENFKIYPTKKLLDKTFLEEIKEKKIILFISKNRD